MYFSLASLASILALLPLLTAAVPARVTTSRGIAVAITKRSSSLDGGVVDISKMLSGIRGSVAKFREGFATYERNTGNPHPLSRSTPPSRRGSLSVAEHLNDNDDNRLWSGDISVGTPPKSFSVVFDTGSSDFFLFSPECRVNCSGHTLYDPSASSTAQDLHETFSLSYGDGSTAAGEKFLDVVSIGGLTAESQTLGATIITSGFDIDRFPPDGLMGLAYPSLSGFNAPPVFQTLISEGVLTSAIFGFKLATSGSELFLGGTNSNLYTGSFNWISLTNQSFWQASFDSISVNGIPVVGNNAAIFDTGTTGILGDPDGIAALFGAISGALPAPHLAKGVYTIPCTFNTPISIYIGGVAVSISPTIFNRGPVSEGSRTCVAGAAADSSLTEFWILGDVFLRNVYSAWDVGNGRIGFATLA